MLDVIPFYVADQNGYFKEQGLQVQLIPVKSAQERDSLMQAGQIDGMLSDLISTGLFNKDTVKVKVVYKARRPYPDAPQYRILAAPNSTLKSPVDLKGVPIGMSQNTSIEYVTNRLLQAQGLAASDIKPEEVTAITVRYEQLMNGNLKAATMPDPLAQGAIAGGAKLVIDDAKYPQFTQSDLAFRIDVLKDRPNTVKKALVAWEKAVQEINAHPEKYQDLLISKGNVPQAIQGTYKMPPFPLREQASPSDVSDVLQWMKGKGLVTRDIPYGDMVDTSFIPK